MYTANFKNIVGILPFTQIHIKWEIVLQVQKCIHAVFRLNLFRDGIRSSQAFRKSG